MRNKQRSHKKKDYESDSAEDEDEEESYGANRENCLPDMFAVCRAEPNGEKGLELVKITAAQREDIIGDLYMCTRDT